MDVLWIECRIFGPCQHEILLLDKPVGVSKDNGDSGGLVEVNDQLYECLTKHFKIL